MELPERRSVPSTNEGGAGDEFIVKVSKAARVIRELAGQDKCRLERAQTSFYDVPESEFGGVKPGSAGLALGRQAEESP